MARLNYKPIPRELDPGITLLQHIHKKNTALQYIELKVIEMSAGSVFQEYLGMQEVCIVALTGKITVTDGDQTFEAIGTRDNVFEKIPTDSVYISIEQEFKIMGDSKATVVLCYAPSQKKNQTRLIKAAENTVEHRGQYQNKRLVHNILPDNSPFADCLLVVEVFTDGGNWSSYPPHKHDQDNLPLESKLEETYYHEMNPRQGFVFQRVYTDDRLLDETMTVENGDVVVVPEGYHPVGVPDGYDSYYLNVMAGPIRKWQFHNDPDHEWILTRE
ncbi:5-deoxy-glucuronate isomerase [Candidatus Enterococcus mansonii]|uniref:5-deoxy-glucuronate isomerase n=1 Tax=Candidatus Enterococcus mansonii TaxID=1834181 RepID=A0A242CF61_9ENTE|nr:5-deoxy-glucuronate isomerase [Enterococcus sp. 4G2_DIV0659]OTO08894.1 hypothetical protein A5880_001894 [Enterococcus sp. 4G2_DIV0659]